MIETFADTLPDLESQFHEYLAVGSPSRLEMINEISQNSQMDTSDDGLLDHFAATKTSDLATIESMRADVDAFLQQAEALATEKHSKNYPPSVLKKVTQRDCLKYAQVSRMIERVAKTLTVQLENINARIWYKREELKNGMHK